MKIGDIHWVDLPGSGGRSQYGRRPAMIIQDEKYAGNLPTVIVVPLTSTQKALRFAGTTASLPPRHRVCEMIRLRWYSRALQLTEAKSVKEWETPRKASVIR